MSVRRWWPPIAWAALILIVSSTPGSSLPQTGISDKIEHASAYFVLAALCVRAMRLAPGLREVALTLAALSLFGALDEWHQGFIPGRDPDSLDWIADTIGAAGGIAFASVMRNMLARRTPGLGA